MSFDNRLRDELHRAASAHDLREEDALHEVKASQPAGWRDLTVVALESTDIPRSQHVRSQRVVGALAACALVAGAVALPLSLRTHAPSPIGAGTPNAGGDFLREGPCAPPVTTGYRSTAIVRVAAAPSSAAVTQPAGVTLGDPVRLALALCNQVTTRSHLTPGDARFRFDATINTTGDLLSLTVTAPTREAATMIPRNWTTLFVAARIADAKRQIRQRQHDLNVRTVRLHNDLQRVDAQLTQLDAPDYANVRAFDAPNGNLVGRVKNPPPPVPERGSVKALNLAFERIQLLTSLRDAGKGAAFSRVAAVKPDVYATVVSQSAPVYVHPPHRDHSTVLLAVGLLLGGVLLAGSAFMLGRRTRPKPVTVETGGSP